MSSHMLRKLIFFFVLPMFLFARGKVEYQQIHSNIESPWLTGPLLAPAPVVISAGHFNIEPYFFAIAYTGSYNNQWKEVAHPTFWSNAFQLFMQFGLTSWLDIELTPTAFWNYSQHSANWELGDLPIGFDIQLYTSNFKNFIPSFKLSLKEIVPIGKYRNLKATRT